MVRYSGRSDCNSVREAQGLGGILMEKLDFYYKMLIESEKMYKYKNFLTYITRAKKELMMDQYTLSDISDFFIKLDDNLIDKEYKVLAGVFYSQTIYQKVPQNDVVHHFEVVVNEENADPLFKEKNLILHRRF